MRRKATHKHLIVAISEAVSNPEIIACAKHIGEKFCAEDGVENAVKLYNKSRSL